MIRACVKIKLSVAGCWRASLEGNRPAHGPDAAPDISPASDAPVERPDDPRTKTGSAEDQMIGWSEASERSNEAARYEPGRKAGE